MNQKKFNLVNRICAVVALAVSAVTYLLTIEPTASFWDCGEFIASSYKLEVGHPPGNPMFQLIARFFTMFGDNMHAAVLVNAMSALCSAFTIFFLYLTIVWFVKRMIRVEGEYSTGQAIAVFGSGLTGALAYCFSDTFWFSAVEGEVYAMSSLFTALVFWVMTVWYDRADQPHSNKWIVLIAFLMGLSIGVHLLNLLAVPALVFMFYYRKREEKPFSFGEFLKIFLVGMVILALILFIIIPYVPKFAAYVDLFFVNALGLPYNVGAAFFILALLGVCFWGLFKTLETEKVFANTALLCFTTIIIGFSVFSLDIIRSCAKTPTNEYQPDNAFTLVRYLSREQYGSAPLLYGQYYDAKYDIDFPSYWAPLNGKYRKVASPLRPKYRASGKMLFPRMWMSGGDEKTESFYQLYTDGKKKKPSMGENLSFFFDYQLNWMYWRYFMWNFVGRQNQIHSPSPGNIFLGNWESGVKFIDKIVLGNQKDAPESLKNDPGKNHYYFLPLLLGLLGLCFQFDKDKKGCWLNFLMFFMTGIAIVIYLNQPPYQPRERDYAYAGSFYFFCVWIGLAVAAIYNMVARLFKDRDSVLCSSLISVLCLLVPVLMAQQNWDDHDRSDRRTAVELAYNYLNSVGPDGILITHGDNDTFPLWYAQEVENVRTDVRICNTSLLGTDWYLDQMKWTCNKSAPLPISVPQEQYLYGTNEMVPIVDSREQVMDIHDVMTLFKHPQVKVSLAGGKKVDYIASRKISVPVNKENVIKSGILDARYADRIPDKIILEIPKGKEYLSKPELFLLDFLDGYRWDRPLNMLNRGGDLNIGIKEYLEFEGFSYKFIPIRNSINTTESDIGFVDTDALYERMVSTYKWDALSAEDYFVDYQNVYTHLGVVSIRAMFLSSANAFIKAGENERAEEMLNACLYITRRFPIETIPYDMSGNDYVVVGMVSAYYRLGKKDEAKYVATTLGKELLSSAKFYLEFYEWAKDDFEMAANYIYFLASEIKKGGDTKLAEELLGSLSGMMKAVSETS